MTFRQAKTLLKKRNLAARDGWGWKLFGGVPPSEPSSRFIFLFLLKQFYLGVALESGETTQEIRTRVVAFVEDMKQADLKQLAERHQHYFAEAGPAFKVWCAAMRKDRVWADLDFAVFF